MTTVLCNYIQQINGGLFPLVSSATMRVISNKEVSKFNRIVLGITKGGFAPPPPGEGIALMVWSGLEAAKETHVGHWCMSTTLTKHSTCLCSMNFIAILVSFCVMFIPRSAYIWDWFVAN